MSPFLKFHLPELLQGAATFNRGEWFAAHERWEALWRTAPAADKPFLQGLVHTAVGLHHAAEGNRKGAEAQWIKALARFEGYPDSYGGVSLAALRDALRALPGGGPSPKILWSEASLACDHHASPR